jgi:uncharacterized protein YggU (UPF0235/DUF167 family)
MSLIHIKAFPDASRDHVETTEKGDYRVFTREPAKDNRANKRVLLLIQNYLHLESSKMRIIRGHRGTSKIIEILDEK